MSGLVLESVMFPIIPRSGWTKRTTSVPSRIFTTHVVNEAFVSGRSSRVLWPPTINTRMPGGPLYLVVFQDTIRSEHVDGTGVSSEKNELIGEGSVETQLEFDEWPTVWIEDTNVAEPPATIRRT